MVLGIYQLRIRMTDQLRQDNVDNAASPYPVPEAEAIVESARGTNVGDMVW